MGKPRLADAVALRLEPTYDGGVRWVNLRESKTPEELAAACLARSVRAIFEPRWGALSPEGDALARVSIFRAHLELPLPPGDRAQAPLPDGVGPLAHQIPRGSVGVDQRRSGVSVWLSPLGCALQCRPAGVTILSVGGR